MERLRTSRIRASDIMIISLNWRKKLRNFGLVDWEIFYQIFPSLQTDHVFAIYKVKKLSDWQ